MTEGERDSGQPLRGIGGIVLCGGRSIRMGRPKAWLPFGGEFLLQRVVRILQSVVDPVVVVAAPGQELPELPEGVIVGRDEEAFRGPLNGLATGLELLTRRASIVYATSCDAPFLQAEFVKCVVRALGDSLACAPEVGGYTHPLAAAYRVEVLPVVREMLAQGRSRLVELLQKVPARLLKEPDLVAIDPGLRSLRNLNTPEEFESAVRQTSD
jgi:molybdopterin-guanine dinucleotide biosynthesis protein A